MSLQEALSYQPAWSESASSSGSSMEMSSSPALTKASLGPGHWRGTPEPGSSWSLSGRTGGLRSPRWLLLVPGQSTAAIVTSLLRVQGATEPPVVWESLVSPHTGHENIAGHNSPWFRAADPMLTPTPAPGEDGDRNHQ